MNKIKYLTLLTCIAAMQLLFAEVNKNNGNFNIAYEDILSPGGDHDLAFIRTYNSTGTELGWFGIGWGSTFETKLEQSVDGSVVIKESGAGARTRFTPKDSINPEGAAKKIVDAMKAKEPMSEQATNTLMNHLKNSAIYRDEMAKKYGLVENVKVGNVLYSNERGIQTLYREKDGWKRVSADGPTDYFDNSGKLIKMTDRNGYSVSLEYKGNYLSIARDSMGKQLVFEWETGKLKSISNGSKTKAIYEFKGDSVSKSTDIQNNVFKYSYDDNKNLSAIEYSDATKYQIKYDKNGLCSEVIERNGSSTQYKYESNPKNPDHHYWTTITEKSKAGAVLSTAKYEYEIKTKADGQEYTYRTVYEIDNVKTETIYSECCSMPVKITRGKEVTTFEYNSKGLLIKKTSTKGDFVKLEYDEKINKITKVINNDGWTSFSYDGAANLTKAVNQEGKSVLLVYNKDGRIIKMLDQMKNDSATKRTLNFKYNAIGKPVEIEVEKLGKVNVTYDSFGEPLRVEPTADSASSKSNKNKDGVDFNNSELATNIMSAFNGLLYMVKPAGVNLSL